MHLDDSYVKLATALLQLGSAYLALRQVRFLKKSESRRRTSTRIRLFKKINSVPRGIASFFKKKKKRLTTVSGVSQSPVLKMLESVDVCFLCIDNDRIAASNLNRNFRFYM